MSGRFQSKLKKIVLFGTTGAGKTTFVKNFSELIQIPFDGSSEVKRHVNVEEQQLETFTPIERQQFENSTTTVSMNTVSILFALTKTNQLEYYPLEVNQEQIPVEKIDCVYPLTIFDPAGQSRFSFMADIAAKGLDAAIIFADGSNIASIERVSNYLDLIKSEEEKMRYTVPKMVFVNKQDLENKGTYVGSSSVKRWLEQDIPIFETTNFDMDTFMFPIRNMLNEINDFPVDLNEVLTIE